MLSNVTISTLQFDSKHITGEAAKLLTSKENNKYIEKGITGLGATTALFNHPLGNYLIISPNVGMIIGKKLKKGEFTSHKQFFIYSGSKDTWVEVLDYLRYSDTQNLIINTTPNQILKIHGSLVYQKIICIPVFVDEIHAYSQDGGFRNEMGEFMELVFHQWEAIFTLSTATPIYRYLDIPNDVPIQHHRVERTIQPKRHLDMSNDRKAIREFVYEQHELNRLLVIFTNIKYWHESFKDLRVANLVGQTLGLKLKPLGRGIQPDEVNYDDIDVLMLSSSYFAGFDIDEDCSVLIISDQKSEASKINVNNIVQAYGRCRENVHQALFVNLLATHTYKGQPITIPKNESEIQVAYNRYLEDIDKYKLIEKYSNPWHEAKEEGFITQANYVNRGKLFQEVLATINDYQLYNPDVLVKLLEDYGFTTSDYINDKEKVYKELGSTFKERLICLMKIEQDELLVDYSNIKKKLINKDEGSFSPKLALEFLTAYLLNQANARVLIERLGNKRLYSGEFYKSVNLFLSVNGGTRNHSKKLSVNELRGAKVYADDFAKEQLSSKVWLTDDWQMLYSIYKISVNKFSSDISEELSISEILYDKQLYLKYKGNTNNRLSNTRTAITKSLGLLEIPITNTRLELINRVIKSNFKKIDSNEYINYNSKKSLKRRMKEAIIFLVTNGQSGKGRTIKNREYNPITLLPRALRPILPIWYVEVDLTSANPQIIDEILGTSIALYVYKNLAKKRRITISQAKKLFNETLNKHYLNTSEAVKIYLDAGYPKEKAKELAALTTGVESGDFYITMTQAEEELTNLYKQTLFIKTFRFHDAIVMKESDVRDNNIILPLHLERMEDDNQLTPLEKLAFHVSYYNDHKTKYEGMVSHKPHPTDKTIPNYRMFRGIKMNKSRMVS